MRLYQDINSWDIDDWDAESLDTVDWKRLSWGAMARHLSTATRRFGERVRHRRNELQLSQEALADLAGLHWTFVGQVERGQRNLNLHNICKLAKALKTDPGTLVEGLKPPS
jgi:ribosome-binding protein aMBF1 (putative translation factor)